MGIKSEGNDRGQIFCALLPGFEPARVWTGRRWRRGQITHQTVSSFSHAAFRLCRIKKEFVLLVGAACPVSSQLLEIRQMLRVSVGVIG
jgi:hypothetical protein